MIISQSVHESLAEMLSSKILILVIVVALLIFVHQSDAWRRRRRRRCPVRDCQVSSWSSWSSCSTSECGQRGLQSRSRQEESSASCGGAQCPDLHETRQCYGNTPRDCQVSSWSPWSFCSAAQCGQQGSQSKSRTEKSSSACGGAECPDLHETRQCYASKRVDCQLSSWSEWSACTVPCGVSGTQHSARHRIVTEQCGGTCTSTFRKTRACPDLSCLNGGSLKDGTCFCKEGYSGNCCEKKGFDKDLFCGIFIPACVMLGIAIAIKCWWTEIKECIHNRSGRQVHTTNG
ncbi:thrombospondin type-1 domain-containing protein 7B-like [Orbicella faveolata]|uniref:thrombospondin type-1 domain-containing protein 7B-like n=1 Tax=Orbicella faveolata TaxID=48498 RepID=UPI0009E3ABD4|nr:thrombospondin type-1 domain-containing protein 7B-like [Orbicella faveolata]